MAVYDAFYKFPSDNDRAGRFEELQSLQDREDKNIIDSAGLDRLHELEGEFSDADMSAPKHHSVLDIRAQYFFIVLCFPLALLFLVTWIISAKRHYTYSSDGTITAPEGVFFHDRVTGLNLTKWQSKSIARLEIDGGPDKGGLAIKLDAWIYDGLEEMIDIYNRRFHPEEFEKEAAVDVEVDVDKSKDLQVDADNDNGDATKDTKVEVDVPAQVNAKAEADENVRVDEDDSGAVGGDSVRDKIQPDK